VSIKDSFRNICKNLTDATMQYHTNNMLAMCQTEAILVWIVD